ncbi:MAG: cell division protein ZapA [Alphaproteobacteria bacterium]|nr:MAG: cell division protein ZapA [Alphaproteobacteria bacterium]
MPEVTISVGGRDFTIICQDGEEGYLRTAAALLDAEATALLEQIGRLPEPRMLLMAGLMLADKTAGLEDEVRALKNRLTQQERLIEEMSRTTAPEPEAVEVPVIPPALVDSLAEIAARAEAIAEEAEERVAGTAGG